MMDEAGEQVGQIVGQGRIGQPQRRLKGLFGKSGEQAAQGVFGSRRPHETPLFLRSV